MKRVLVTGGAGFIGSHIVERLLAAGYRVAVVDDLSNGDSAHVPEQATFFQGDVRDRAFLETVFREFRPDYVSHQAAQISVPESVRNPSQDASVNVLGLLTTLECAAEHGVERFLFASSGGLYGEVWQPANETAPLQPVVPYTIAKLAGEWYCRFFRRQRGLPTLSLRYGNVYGPRQGTQGEAGVVAAFAEALARGQVCTIYGDGLAVRDFVYVGDVAEANLLALSQAIWPEADAVNVATGRTATVRQVFELLRRELAPAAEPAFAPPRAGDVRANVLDPGLAARLLGWRPKVSLEEGLKATANWFRIKARAARPE